MKRSAKMLRFADLLWAHTDSNRGPSDYELGQMFHLCANLAVFSLFDVQYLTVFCLFFLF